MKARTGTSFAVYRRETSRWSRVKRSGCKQTKFDIQIAHLALNAVLRVSRASVNTGRVSCSDDPT